MAEAPQHLTTAPHPVHLAPLLQRRRQLPPQSPSASPSPHSSNGSSVVVPMLVAGSVVGGVLALTLPFVVLPAMGQSLPYMATPVGKLQRALRFIVQHEQQLLRYSKTAAFQRSYTRPNKNHTTTTTDTKPASWRTQTTFVHALAESKRTPTAPRQRQFLDLGSGDGEAVYQAVQLRAESGDATDPFNDNNNNNNYYYTRCTGVELNSTLFLYSRMRRTLFWTRDEQSRSHFVCRDCFQFELSDDQSTSNGRSSKNTFGRNDNHTVVPRLLRDADTILIFGIPSLMRTMSETLARYVHQPQSESTTTTNNNKYVLSYRFELPVTEPLLRDGKGGLVATTQEAIQRSHRRRHCHLNYYKRR